MTPSRGPFRPSKRDRAPDSQPGGHRLHEENTNRHKLLTKQATKQVGLEDSITVVASLKVPEPIDSVCAHHALKGWGIQYLVLSNRQTTTGVDHPVEHFLQHPDKSCLIIRLRAINKLERKAIDVATEYKWISPMLAHDTPQRRTNGAARKLEKISKHLLRLPGRNKRMKVVTTL